MLRRETGFFRTALTNDFVELRSPSVEEVRAVLMAYHERASFAHTRFEIKLRHDVDATCMRSFFR